jgi:hypothetical protein
MWYNRQKQYLRKTFSQSGLGVLLMAKKPDNTFEACQMDANGAIVTTGGGGDATAANQSAQITEAQTTNTLLTSINTNIPAAGTEVSKSQTLTGTATTLGSAACRSITIYMLSTAANNAEIIINAAGGGTAILLEPGYSMQIAATNLNLVTVSQGGGGGEVIYFKYL